MQAPMLHCCTLRTRPIEADVRFASPQLGRAVHGAARVGLRKIVVEK